MNRQQRTRLAIRSLVLLAIAVALAPAASAQWNEKVLYSFQGGATDGALPAGGVVFDAAGNLYGATTQGFGFCAPAQCGSVFQLTPPAKKGDPWTETVLHVFTGNSNGDGDTPVGGLVIDRAGNLYGTAGYGGTGDCVLLGTKVGCGIVYKMTPPQTKGGKWVETVLHSFPTSKQGYLPNGDLVFDGAGNLYGATMFGGGHGTTCNDFYQYCGAVFELSPPKTKGGKWTEKVLHGFKGGTDGANPNGGLVLDSNGNVYGTTYIGGYNCPHNSGQGCGTAFELKLPDKKDGAWAEKVLHRFKRDSSDGGNPMAGLRFDRLGNLYGTNLNGGPGLYGTVFSLKPPFEELGPWVETVLYGFSDDERGADPTAGVIFDLLGNLYATALGGSTHRGVVFRLKPPQLSSSWPLTVLYSLTGSPDGDHPTASLTLDSRGNLYSTTEWGGTGQSCQGGCGTVFEVEP
jgi:hypothetical protein